MIKENLKKFFGRYGLLVAWIQAIVAMGGSLYYSEIALYPPCVLCWWQRIAIYPFALILGIAYARRDANIAYYVLPVAIIGWCISLFHNLLYYKFISDSLAPCKNGVSCTTVYVEYYGFITIPLMAFTALTVIIICVYLNKQYATNIVNKAV